MVVADAGMLSAANLNALGDPGFSFIVGARLPKAPNDWRRIPSVMGLLRRREDPGVRAGDGRAGRAAGSRRVATAGASNATSITTGNPPQAARAPTSCSQPRRACRSGATPPTSGLPVTTGAGSRPARSRAARCCRRPRPGSCRLPGRPRCHPSKLSGVTLLRRLAHRRHHPRGHLDGLVPRSRPSSSASWLSCGLSDGLLCRRSFGTGMVFSGGMLIYS